MTRSYRVNDHGFMGYTVDLIDDQTVVASLPFRSQAGADRFGREYVLDDPERIAAMKRHPAGKRRLAEQ